MDDDNRESLESFESLQPMSTLALKQLETEAISVLREAHGELARLGLLFSGGKDSIVLAHLARRAFHPAPPPFPLIHVDTGHNFPETLTFRDRFAEQLGYELQVWSVQDSIDLGRVAEEPGPRPSRNRAQTVTLLDGIRRHRLDGVFGGARRDEERARAKERFYSLRDAQGRWHPERQRAECWGHFNSLRSEGEHFRIFPLSNWSEMDIWRYIQWRELEVPSLYYSHVRRVIETDGLLLAESPWTPALKGETVSELQVRFRTLGDLTCSGAWRSQARNVDEVLQELMTLRRSERAGRADDRHGPTGLEERKVGGYF